MAMLRTKYLLQPLLRWNPQRLLMGLRVTRWPRGHLPHLSGEGRVIQRSDSGSDLWATGVCVAPLEVPSAGWIFTLRPTRAEGCTVRPSVFHIKRHKLWKDILVPYRRRGFFRWNSEVIHLSGLWSLLKVLSPNKLLKLFFLFTFGNEADASVGPLRSVSW